VRQGDVSAWICWSARRWTYAGVVADALAYDGLECEFAFVKHGGDGGQDLRRVAIRGHVGGLCYRMM